MTREEQIREHGCCATCVCWQRIKGGVGECWSGDRLDGVFSKGSAGTTFAYDICEAHCDRVAIDVPPRPSTTPSPTSEIARLNPQEQEA